MEMLLPWIYFAVSAVVVVIVADRLARYGDVISVRTGVGGLLVGTILLAGATSLPEFIASISAFRVDLPDLAAGNFFGSNMVNMAILALVDLINFRIPLLRRVAITHTLTAAVGATMMVVAVIFMLADIDLTVGWVGVESLILIGLYIGGAWLVRQEGKQSGMGMPVEAMEPGPEFPTLRRGLIGFTLSAGVLLIAVPVLVQASADIADQTGLGASFVGTALLSLVTSLPELLAAMAAVRLGAMELAVGNLFGSTVFNMLAIGIADFFYLEGRFLGNISRDFALVGLLGLMLTLMALIGNLARVERRFLFIELDALAIIVVYILGLVLLFINGLGI